MKDGFEVIEAAIKAVTDIITGDNEPWKVIIGVAAVAAIASYGFQANDARSLKLLDAPVALKAA